MKAEIVGIYDRGVLDKERVHFRISQDANLSYYAIFDAVRSSPESISAGFRTCYWFGPLAVKAGENVVLYTRAGSQTKETKSDGAIFHFFFRGSTQPIYANVNAAATLFELATWITSK